VLKNGYQLPLLPFRVDPGFALALLSDVRNIGVASENLPILNE
jgi:hypothetical protein